VRLTPVTQGSSEVHRGYLREAIWIRLPQVSSKTAVVTGPISAGSCVKRTPKSRSRLNSV
jgi:hypothetical protein